MWFLNNRRICIVKKTNKMTVIKEKHIDETTKKNIHKQNLKKFDNNLMYKKIYVWSLIKS